MQQNDVPVVPIVLAIFAIVGFVLLIGMIGLIGYLISRAAKRRSYDTARGRQMEEAAAQLGLNFHAQAELAALPFFAGFELFEGYPLKLENLMTGRSVGGDVAIFDLVYRNVGAGGSGTTTSRQTMAAIVSSELRLPTFYVRPEGAIETALNAVSAVDIDFEERPDFSRKFMLYGSDEAAIRKLFDGQKFDFFEKNAALSAAGSGNVVLL
ncbi:MAG: hypothetical protein ABJA02_03310, partial [Acidobacteriota bacterium]